MVPFLSMTFVFSDFPLIPFLLFILLGLAGMPDGWVHVYAYGHARVDLHI